MRIYRMLSATKEIIVSAYVYTSIKPYKLDRNTIYRHTATGVLIGHVYRQ